MHVARRLSLRSKPAEAAPASAPSQSETSAAPPEGKADEASPQRRKSLFRAAQTGGFRTAEFEKEEEEEEQRAAGNAPVGRFDESNASSSKSTAAPKAKAGAEKLPLFSPMGEGSAASMGQAQRVAKLIGRMDAESEIANPRRLSNYKREASTEPDNPNLTQEMTQLAISLSRKPKAPTPAGAPVPRRSSLLASIAAPMRPTVRLPNKSDLRPTAVQVQSVPVAPTVGISITRLVAVLPPDKVEGLSMAEAVAKIISPMTDGAILARYLTAQSSSSVKPFAEAYIIYDPKDKAADFVSALLASGLSVDAAVHVPELCGPVDDAESLLMLPKAVVLLSDERFSTLRDPAKTMQVCRAVKDDVQVVFAMPPAAADAFAGEMAAGKISGGTIVGLLDQVSYDVVEDVKGLGPFQAKMAVQPLLRDFMVTVAKRALEKEGLTTADGANLNETLGSLYFVLRDFENAETYFRKAVDLGRTQEGGGGEALADRLLNLASSMVALKKYVEATPVLDEAKSLVPSDWPLSASVTLAQLLFETDRTWEGRDVLAAHLAKTREKYAPDDLRVADALVALANYQQAINEIIPAKNLLVQALEVHVKVLGEDINETATDCNMIGVILADLGMFADAKPYLERSLRIREKINPNGFELGQAFNVLAFLLLQMGNNSEATALGRRACDIFARHVAPDNALLVESLRLWGM